MGERIGRKRSPQRAFDAQVQLHEGKARLVGQQRQTRSFQSGIVIIVEIVDPRDRGPDIKERACGMVPDETRRSGDQHFHAHSALALTYAAPPGRRRVTPTRQP